MRLDSFKIWTSDAVQGMTSNMLRFLIYSLKFQEIKPKKMNLCLFSEVFRLRPLTPYELRQMKSLMKIHNRDKFNQCSICGCQVINLPMFSWRCNIHEMALFSEGGGRGGSILKPKYCQILLNISLEVVFKDTQTNNVWRILEKFELLQKREIPKVCTYGATLTLFFPLKTAKIEKSKYF